MSDNTKYIEQLASASRDLQDGHLTVAEGPRRDYYLVNRQGCEFDRIEGVTIEEAIEWAGGRGRDEYYLYCKAYGRTALIEAWNADMYRRESLGLPALSIYHDQWDDE